MIAVVDKKVAAGVAAVTVVGLAALAIRKAEAPPEEEGAPRGRLHLEVIPFEAQGYAFDDVRGQGYFTGAIVRVTGRATSGDPAPDMTLEIYDNAVLADSAIRTGVNLGQDHFLEVTISTVGGHIVYGKMTLDNPIGTFEFETAPQSFNIGTPPTGDLTLTVTPM